MQFHMNVRARRGVAVLAAIGLVGAVGVRAARASDHQDNPLVELNPAMDMSDFYAFPGGSADRIVLAMDTRPLLTPAATPGASFDPNILYQFKIDNTGDAKEDKVIQITFRGTGASQTFEVRGPMAPPVVGGMATHRNRQASTARGRATLRSMSSRRTYFATFWFSHRSAAGEASA